MLQAICISPIRSIIASASSIAQGVIFTFAGTGKVSAGGGGTFGDGGLAINALIYLPSGVFADNSGNVYIADTGDNIIRKVTSDGIINTVAGDGFGSYSGDNSSALGAELHTPEDVWVDSSANIYIADSANAAIREVAASTGIITTVAGYTSPGYPTVGHTGDGGLATSASITTPYAVTVDSSGNIYFAEHGDSVVRKVTASNMFISTIAGDEVASFSGDGGPASKASLNFLTGICLDSSGNLYIADTLNRRIRKVSGGNINTIAGNGILSYSGDGGPAGSAQLNTPQSVAVDSSGNVYIADTVNNVVRKINTSGVITTFAGNGTAGFGGDGGPPGSAQLNGPEGVAVDSSGNVYISDTHNARVRKVSGGAINTVAGNGSPGYSGDNGPATSAQIEIPLGLAVDSAGNLYIADFVNNVVRKVSGGTITTVAGTGLVGQGGDGVPATTSALNGPTGVAVDSNGNLYISDANNNVVREVSGGTIRTIAGNHVPGYSGDGGPATAAMLANPGGIAVDASGNVYIADGSSVIRKLYPTGFITTIAGNGTQGYSGDGGSAPLGMLNAPAAVAVASNNNVYVADAGNNAIRELIYGGYQLSISAAANAGSNQAGAVSPGDIVVLYGTAMSPAGQFINRPNASGNYSTSLNGVSVYFGDYAAPLLYVSPNQINAVVPFEVSGSTVQVFVVSQGQYSTSFPVIVAQASPGIFTANLSGTGLAAAINIHNQTVSYNTAANPANAGDYVEIFLTGTSQTNPAGVDGQPYASSPLPNCVLNATVTIGGKNAFVQYCGGIPGEIPGVTQINVQVPSGLSAGLLPLTVQMGAVSAQTGVTLAISGQ